MASQPLFFLVESNPCIKIDEDDLLKFGMLQAHFSTKGYVRVSYQKKLEYLHRLIKNLPAEIVDHINRDKLDNRKENLRLVTPAQSSDNISSHQDGSSKYLGVYWSKEKGKWAAQIMIKGQRKHLGYFTDELKAKASYEFNRQLLRG